MVTERADFMLGCENNINLPCHFCFCFLQLLHGAHCHLKTLLGMRFSYLCCGHAIRTRSFLLGMKISCAQGSEMRMHIRELSKLMRLTLQQKRGHLRL